MYNKITYFYKAAQWLERTNNALETTCNTKNLYDKQYTTTYTKTIKKTLPSMQTEEKKSVANIIK